jgi:predicted nucleic-acid-binding protein
MAVNSLDANVVLRYLLNDIPEQSLKAKKVINGSASYVTDVVAVEIIFVLERVIGMERSDIVKLLKSFISLPNLIYNNYFLDQAIDLYGNKKNLSIVDCYAATEAKVYDHSLITFDRELVKNGGAHVKEA